MQGSKITIKDVARKAGVSVGTASRAMNGAPGVLPRTREIVHQAAAELGYRPNAAARALRSRSSRLIGCLFPDLENPLYTRLFNALQDRWADEGFVTLITAGSDKADRERRAIQTFAERGLDAIVIAPGHENDAEVLQQLRDFPAPIYVVDRDIDVVADRVLFDHAGGVAMAVQHLVALGHTRILPVFAQTPARPGLARANAFRGAMAKAGLTIPDWVDPDVPESVFQQVSRLVGGPDRPTAMVVQGTQVLPATLNALARAGLSVPGDMSLIAIGDSTLAEDHVPAITALQMDRTELVDTIAGQVLSRLQSRSSAPAEDILHYRLIERASCAPV